MEREEWKTRSWRTGTKSLLDLERSQQMPRVLKSVGIVGITVNSFGPSSSESRVCFTFNPPRRPRSPWRDPELHQLLSRPAGHQGGARDGRASERKCIISVARLDPRFVVVKLDVKFGFRLCATEVTRARCASASESRSL